MNTWVMSGTLDVKGVDKWAVHLVELWAKRNQRVTRACQTEWRKQEKGWPISFCLKRSLPILSRLTCVQGAVCVSPQHKWKTNYINKIITNWLMLFMVPKSMNKSMNKLVRYLLKESKHICAHLLFHQIHTKLIFIKSSVIYTEKTHKYFPGHGQIK